MNVIDMLNSGRLHQAAREQNPDRVCRRGNIHTSAARARFVDWLADRRAALGIEAVSDWPEADRAEYRKRYVGSH